MSFEETHSDKSIKSKMNNFEIVPPDDVWDNIESVLLKNKAIVLRNRIIGAVVAVVLVSIVSLFFNFNKKNTEKQDVPENPSSTSVNISDTTVSYGTSLAKGTTQKKENVRLQNTSVDKMELKDEKNIDTTVQIETPVVKLNTDSIPQNTQPATKVVVKKVVKKPVYIVQQDTIYKVDTLSKKKKR